jgi:quinol monooxygenase YgiN
VAPGDDPARQFNRFNESEKMGTQIFAKFIPREDCVEKVEALIRKMVVNTRREPGCLQYDFYSATNIDGTGTMFCLLESYNGEAALLAHRAADYYKEYRAAIPDCLAGPVDVSVLSPLDAVGRINE